MRLIAEPRTSALCKSFVSADSPYGGVGDRCVKAKDRTHFLNAPKDFLTDLNSFRVLDGASTGGLRTNAEFAKSQIKKFEVASFPRDLLYRSSFKMRIACALEPS
jgi:hypothetical protein